MKIDRDALDRACGRTKTGPYVEGIPLEIQDDANGLAVREIWVDSFGNLVLRSADGTCVLAHRATWDAIKKLMAHDRRSR